jgi:hypothetical protein
MKSLDGDVRGRGGGATKPASIGAARSTCQAGLYGSGYVLKNCTVNALGRHRPRATTHPSSAWKPVQASVRS